MTPTYVRIAQLASTPKRQGMLPVSSATIWRWTKQGHFPQPVRLGPQVSAWLKADVDAWIAQRSPMVRGTIGAKDAAGA